MTENAPVAALVTLDILLIQLCIERRVRLILLLAPRLNLGLELGGDDCLELRKAQPTRLCGLGHLLEIHVLVVDGVSCGVWWVIGGEGRIKVRGERRVVSGERRVVGAGWLCAFPAPTTDLQRDLSLLVSLPREHLHLRDAGRRVELEVPGGRVLAREGRVTCGGVTGSGLGGALV